MQGVKVMGGRAEWQRLPNYIKTLGLSDGFRTFANIYLKPRRPGSLFSVRVGEHVLWLRNTASDKSIFFQIWIKKEYDARGWPQLWDRLQSAYYSIVKAGRTPLIIDAGANIG